MAGINFTDEREYQPKLTFKNKKNDNTGMI